MKRPFVARWVGFWGVTATFLLAAGGCRRIDPPAARPEAVQVVKLRRVPVACEMRFSATVRERQRMELSFKVPGTVVAVLQVTGADGKLRDFHEGDVVGSDTGRPLARLDDADYRRRAEAARERLAQAQAKEKAMQANRVVMRATFDRIKALRERGSVAQQAFDEALAKRDAADAEMEAAQREVSAAGVAVQQAEDDLSNCSLAVPIPKATVSRKYVEVNMRVGAAQPVFQIMDLSSLRVAFGVSDKKMGQFQLGQRVAVTAETFRGESFGGQVTKIAPAADLRTRTFEVEVTIAEPKGLKPGMVVTILAGQREEMVLLPMTSVVRGQSDADLWVYTVVEEDGRPLARRRRVVLGGVYDNQMRLVEGSPSQVGEGDAVIVAGAFRVTDGQELRVQEAPDPARGLGI